MTLRKIFLIQSLFISFIFFSCTNNSQTETGKIYLYDTLRLSGEEKMQRQIWLQFKKAVTTIDLNAFRQLSLSRIYCPDCNAYLLNKTIDTTVTKDNILIDEFINEGGLKTVFNKNANKFYFNDVNVASIDKVDSVNVNFGNCKGASILSVQKAFEVNIKDNKCSGEECSQTIFTFIDIGNGYKFFSMVNIP